MSVYVFMWVHVFVDTGGGQKSALGVFVLFCFLELSTFFETRFFFGGSPIS